jgi:lipopolysaccharide export system protein LptA
MNFLSSLRALQPHPRSVFVALFMLAVAVAVERPTGLPFLEQPAQAQDTASRAMTLRSDVQEANAKTGVVTARGNVQINYPARKIQATAAQAQYFSRERRIVLSGNVYVLQEGNSMRGETITYLLDEGRFVALPQPSKQVESIYLVPENSPVVPKTNPAPASPFGTKPEFSTPNSGTVTPQLQLNSPGATPLPSGQR